MSGEAAVEALEAIRRALDREAHVLTRHPGLAWQQLHNRLQFEEDVEVQRLIGFEREHRTGQAKPAWIDRYTRPPESDALLRSFVLEGPGLEDMIAGPTGDWLACARTDGTVTIIDAGDGSPLATLGEPLMGETDNFGRGNGLNAVAVDPTGHLVVAGGQDGTLRLWYRESGAEQSVAVAHDGEITSVGVSPTGEFFVTAGEDRFIRVWDTSGRNLASHEFADSGHEITGCSLTADGRQVVVVDAIDYRWVWDWESDAVRVVAARSGRVGSMAVHPGGSLVAVGDRDGPVRLWPSEEDADSAQLSGHISGVAALAFSLDGAYLISASEMFTGVSYGSQSIRVWDLSSQTQHTSLAGHTDNVIALSFSHDSRLLFSATAYGEIRVWDWGGVLDQRMEERALHTGGIEGVAVGLADGAVASWGRDGLVRIWDTSTGEVAAELGDGTDYVTAVAISPDGTLIVTGVGEREGDRLTDRRSLTIWDVASARKIARHESVVFVNRLGFTPDGSLLIVGGGAGGTNTVTILEPESGERVATLEGTGEFHITADGASVIVMGTDQTVRHWDIATRSIRSTSQAGDTPTPGVAPFSDGATRWDVSPDTRLIATSSNKEDEGGRDALVSVRRLEDTAEPAQIPIPAATAVRFDPSKPALVAGDFAGNLHLARLVNIEYGPLVVTPVRRGKTLEVRCLSCRFSFPWKEKHRDSDITCPGRPDCNARLHINPLVTDEMSAQPPEAPEAEPASHAAAATTSTSAPVRPDSSDLLPKWPSVLRINGDGHLYAGYQDGTIATWTESGGTEVSSETQRRPVESMCLPLLGLRAATIDPPNRVIIWSVLGQSVAIDEAHEAPAPISAITPHEEGVAAGLKDGSVWVPGDEPVLLPGEPSPVIALAVLPTGDFVCATADRRIQLRDAATGTALRSFKGLPDPIAVLGAGHGARVAWGCQRLRFGVWDTGQPGPPKASKYDCRVLDVVGTSWLHPDPLVLLAEDDGTAMLVNAASRKLVIRVDVDSPIVSGALSQDGRWLVVLDEQGGIHRVEHLP